MLECFVLLAIIAGLASLLGYGSVAATVAILAKVKLIGAILVGLGLIAFAVVYSKRHRHIPARSA